MQIKEIVSRANEIKFSDANITICKLGDNKVCYITTSGIYFKYTFGKWLRFRSVLAELNYLKIWNIANTSLIVYLFYRLIWK